MLKERIGKVLSLKPARREGGTRGAAWVLVVCLCCLLPFLVLTCATAPKAALKPDDPLFATWVNKEYEGNADFSAKMVLTPDGRELDYDIVSASETELEGKFTIEETWVDAQGNRWYKGQGTYWGWDPNLPGEYHWYLLYKINPGGTVMECVFSEIGYPEEMGPLGGAYSIYHRQE